MSGTLWEAERDVRRGEGTFWPTATLSLTETRVGGCETSGTHLEHIICSKALAFWISSDMVQSLNPDQGYLQGPLSQAFHISKLVGSLSYCSLGEPQTSVTLVSKHTPNYFPLKGVAPW